VTVLHQQIINVQARTVISVGQVPLCQVEISEILWVLYFGCHRIVMTARPGRLCTIAREHTSEVGLCGVTEPSIFIREVEVHLDLSANYDLSLLLTFMLSRTDLTCLVDQKISS